MYRKSRKLTCSAYRFSDDESKSQLDCWKVLSIMWIDSPGLAQGAKTGLNVLFGGRGVCVLYVEKTVNVSWLEWLTMVEITSSHN